MSTLSFIDEFPILRHKLDLGGYHPDLKGNSVEVWLNLADEFQGRLRKFNADVKAQAENEVIANADEMDALFVDLGAEISATTTEHLRQNWNEYVQRVSELARAQSEAPLTDALKQTRVELFADLWNLDMNDVAALFEESKAAGLRAWMRRRTWEIVGEYATGRGEAGGG